MEVSSNTSEFRNRGHLHLLVRSECAKKKISQKHCSSEYRGVVEKCVSKLLEVDSLTPDQYKLVENFCDQVPSFYRRYKSKLEDIERHHRVYFDEPLVYTVEGIDTFVKKDCNPDISV